VWNAIAELDGVIAHHYKNEGNYADYLEGKEARLARIPAAKRGQSRHTAR
jgi:hypothetical protein